MIRNDIILLALELFFCVLLYFVSGLAEKYISTKWRLLYGIPAVLCMFLTALEGFEISLLGLYAGSLLLMTGFFKEKSELRRRACIISAVLILTAVPVSLLNNGYRSISYVSDFKTAMDKIEKHYVLKQHKGIDTAALYEKYLPVFRQAEKNNDEAESCIAWLRLCNEFHDGHVNFSPSGNSRQIVEEALNRVLGNDYGLSLMTLSDGSICAVNVDGSLKEKGISNGTEIISWDGKDPSALGTEAVKYCYFSADIDNENFWRAAYGSGEGGDSVTVTFIDENGSECTAELEKTGEPYYQRLKNTVEIVDQGIETGHLTWVDVNESTAAFRIKLMMADYESYDSGDHSKLKLGIRNKVDELKKKGVDTIILDMRGNSGGSGDMVKAIAELFAPGGVHYYCTDGLWDTENNCYATDEKGNYIKGADVYFSGEDVWAGRKIIMLVNSSAVSAADHLTKVLGQFENVTVTGFTEPNGSAQGVGMIGLESGSLSISGSLLLDSDGGVFIDSGTDRQSGNRLEETIPFDKAAVKALFDEDRDYILDYVLCG